MTDYKAIADRLVERGIGEERHSCYWIDPDDDALGWLDAEDFCHDWRVAGRIIDETYTVVVQEERGIYLAKIWLTEDSPSCGIGDSANSKPLAIILAYLEATDET